MMEVAANTNARSQNITVSDVAVTAANLAFFFRKVPITKAPVADPINDARM